MVEEGERLGIERERSVVEKELFKKGAGVVMPIVCVSYGVTVSGIGGECFTCFHGLCFHISVYICESLLVHWNSKDPHISRTILTITCN